MMREIMKESNSSDNIKFLCSYGGKILPRRSDYKLRYVGGYTRVLPVDQSISYAELMVKLVEFCGFSVTLKCQMPNGDLDTLISVKSDEDLISIVEEYNRAARLNPSNNSLIQKIRAVLAPNLLKKVSPPLSSSSGYGEPVSDNTTWPLFGFPVSLRGAPAKSRCMISATCYYDHRMLPSVCCSPPCCYNFFARLQGMRPQKI